MKTDGSVEKFKARLVAKGYLQQKGLDYHKNYAPSTRQETIRLVLSHMAKEAWESQQLDVMMAFLNSFLNKEVCLKQPEGFVDKDHPTWVRRVRESLYVLKQAPREWIVMLTKELVSYGLSQSKSDPVLFTYREARKVMGAVVVHVDDIIITGRKSFLKGIGGRLQVRFKMSKIRPVDTYLSLKVKRGENHKLYLSQTHYIPHIVDSHLLFSRATHFSRISTPM